MEYAYVTEFINRAKKFGSRLDLTRITKLCALLGNPEKDLKCVHIAGTNGKGSTSVFIASMLQEAGYKTGLYTSPFIYDFNERMQINGVPICDETLLHIMKQVVDATEKMLSEGFEHPTEFELVTAAAFLYFKEENCDVVVLEVGLGGILDSTNVIESPLVSVITSISYDHTEYLGETLTEIAKNKCGIIKENCPVVSYPFQEDDVKVVIQKTAKEKNAYLTVCETQTLQIIDVTLNGNAFMYQGKQYQTTLVGEYQVYNAITAINAVEQLKTKGYILSTEQIQNGVQNAKWPARFEILSKQPTIIADGSHNADGMRSFVKTAKKCLGDKKAICVFGMLKDKDYKACLNMLSELSDTIVVTEVNNPRTETKEMLESAAKCYFNTVYGKKENKEAVALALDIANKDDVVLALGSLYMMKDIKEATEELLAK